MVRIIRDESDINKEIPRTIKKRFWVHILFEGELEKGVLLKKAEPIKYYVTFPENERPKSKSKQKKVVKKLDIDIDNTFSGEVEL